ncbi:MAG: hypothetical protein EPO64_02425 [Nitrospirae bacterium]|nr:MAG: hypothetical protein EPO64_02425 [Nitrospirota bacterium]
MAFYLILVMCESIPAHGPSPLDRTGRRIADPGFHLHGFIYIAGLPCYTFFSFLITAHRASTSILLLIEEKGAGANA